MRNNAYIQVSFVFWKAKRVLTSGSKVSVAVEEATYQRPGSLINLTKTLTANQLVPNKLLRSGGIQAETRYIGGYCNRMAAGTPSPIMAFNR